MREAAARMIETPTAIMALGLMIGMGIGVASVVEVKPTPDLCKAMGYVKGD